MMEDMEDELDALLRQNDGRLLTKETPVGLSIKVHDKYEAMAEAMEHKGPHNAATRHHALASYQRANSPKDKWSEWAWKEEQAAHRSQPRSEIAVATLPRRHHHQQKRRREKRVGVPKAPKLYQKKPHIKGSRAHYMGEDKDSSGRSIPHEITGNEDAAGNPIEQESLLSEAGSPD